MATPEPNPDLASPSSPDLNQVLERQIAAGFPPELAFDLVLHELVVRTAASTSATSAALALARGNEMVCRAATGLQAPDLGVPLNTREGLSGACLHTCQPQLCVDAESDSRVDAEAALHLGIRSMLIVPVIEDEGILGVLEVFSSEPGAFSAQHLEILESFAKECGRLHRALLDSRMRSAAAAQLPPVEPQLAPKKEPVSEPAADLRAEWPPVPAGPVRLYEGWTLMLGAMAILAAIGVSFLIGSRIGWIRASVHPSQMQAPTPIVDAAPPVSPAATVVQTPAPPSVRNPSTNTGAAAARPDELVVYDHGRVIFRMKPAEKSGESVVAAAENARLKAPLVWLAPDEAEQRLRKRTEPVYPSAAREARRAGDVVLEVLVGEDGSVTTMRVVSGDPMLTTAALDAVRGWQYEPYRQNQRAAQFQTDVTLRFSLPQ